MLKPHDRGGWPTDQKIDRSEHQLSDWEKKTHALSTVLGEKDLKLTDEMRRLIESLPMEEYESLSYYEKWAASLESILVEKKVLTTQEIDEKVKALEQRWE